MSAEIRSDSQPPGTICVDVDNDVIITLKMHVTDASNWSTTCSTKFLPESHGGSSGRTYQALLSLKTAIQQDAEERLAKKRSHFDMRTSDRDVLRDVPLILLCNVPIKGNGGRECRLVPDELGWTLFDATGRKLHQYAVRYGVADDIKQGIFQCLSPQHTPGEWNAHKEDNGRWSIESPHGTVAEVTSENCEDDTQIEADARLLAAAPKLASLLQQLVHSVTTPTVKTTAAKELLDSLVVPSRVEEEQPETPPEQPETPPEQPTGIYRAVFRGRKQQSLTLLTHDVLLYDGTVEAAKQSLIDRGYCDISNLRLIPAPIVKVGSCRPGDRIYKVENGRLVGETQPHASSYIVESHDKLVCSGAYADHVTCRDQRGVLVPVAADMDCVVY